MNERKCKRCLDGYHNVNDECARDLVAVVAGAKLGLALPSLREANRLRRPLFKNAKGEPAHTEPDGSDWTLGEWSNALIGEVGEAANIIKKIRRGDFALEEAREDLGREFADILCYLDILADRAGVDLSVATIRKFNEVSERVGAPIRLIY